MSTQIITISEDVINNVVKPISVFLNDVAVGSVLTHVAKKDKTDYGIVKKDDKTIYPVFNYVSSNGGTYKFTTFDLRNFYYNEKSFTDYFSVDVKSVCNLAPVITVLKCEPLLIDGEKAYPLFCYAAQEQYTADKLTLAPNQYPTRRMIDDLKASGLLPEYEDKYYRKLTLDAPIFFYPKK